MSGTVVLIAAVFGMVGGLVGGYVFGWLGAWLFDRFGPGSNDERTSR